MTAYTKLGSSPLSRGIQAFLDPLLDLVRIIPALAGNTVVHGAFRMGRSDHPRSRGEYGFPGTPSGCFHGSSPLSRGILTAIDWQGVPRGIIPALAGNTGRAMNPFT